MAVRETERRWGFAEKYDYHCGDRRCRFHRELACRWLLLCRILWNACKASDQKRRCAVGAQYYHGDQGTYFPIRYPACDDRIIYYLARKRGYGSAYASFY